MPQVNPPRRQREPSPHTPGDNKRQSLRLKAGQQALAGLTLGSRPVSASDNPEVRTPTQPAGREVEPFSPADHARPPTRPPDGLQTAPPQGRGWEALTWTAGPVDSAIVQSSSAGGQDLCPHVAMGDKLQESLSLGDGSHPFLEELEDMREILATHTQLGIIACAIDHVSKEMCRKAALAAQHLCCRVSAMLDQDPKPAILHARPPISSGSGTRGPTAGHGPTPSLAGHLATQEGAKRGGAGVPGTPSSHGPG